VQFFDGATLVGTVALVGGSAALTTNGLTTGSHAISATYPGDGDFAGSSGAAALTVKSSSTSSATTLTSSRNPATVGQSVTFSATVTGPSGTSGNVAFYDGSTLLGTAALSSGVARLTRSSLAAGGHAITARYLGNASVPPSGSTAVAQTIGTQTRSTSIALNASPSPVALGTEVALTATVTGSLWNAPTGSVLFMVNGQVLGQAPAVATGSTTSAAVWRTSALPRGSHKVVVVYLTDATFKASTKSITLTVN